jgi:ribosomal protein S12 methylthiotransferase
LLVGHELPVLVEGPTADSDLVWQARLSTQAPEIDGVCYITDPGESPLRQGEMRRMRITKAHDYDLSGELTDAGASFVPPTLLASAAPLIQIDSALATVPLAR